jgi:serine phosphatase RsbU (regulator of sigma subunit)
LFYLTTDGFLDQNGGEKNFKFGKKKFEALLIELNKYPLECQTDIIARILDEYKKDTPQRDDITVLGFKV